MKVHAKDFDTWNKIKQTVNQRVIFPLFKEQDIWWTAIGVNIGFEEDGKHEKFIRPVLVLKKFSKEFFLGLPMSSKLKNNPYYYQVKVKNKEVSVLVSQLRVFSAQRFEDKLGTLDRFPRAYAHATYVASTATRCRVIYSYAQRVSPTLISTDLTVGVLRATE